MKANLETLGTAVMVISAIGGVVVAVISQMQLSKLDTIEVKEELVNQAIEAAVEKKVDQEKLKKEVTVKAKEAIVAKFDGQLDDQLVEFNRNLENVGKIYQSIAQKMDPGTGGSAKGGVNLTIS